MIEYFFYWFRQKCGYRKVHHFTPYFLDSKDWVVWKFRPKWKQGSYTSVRGEVKFKGYDIDG